MKRLQYAMVGGAEGSFIGPIHRMAIRMDDLADLVAGDFSRHHDRNVATGEKLRLAPERVYDDWRELLAAEKGRIDFLTICTTNESHFAIAKAALEAGLDVFCEKPLSLTVEEAEALGALARRKRKILGVPFTYEGYPMIKLARDLVAKGELGAIDKIVLEYQQGSFRRPNRRVNNWKMDPKVAGPSCVLADIGVHAFSMIEYVSGLEVKSVLADVSSYGNDAGLEDDASVLMRLSGKTSARQTPKATLVTSKVATGEENGVRLRVYGEKASLYWDQESPNYLTVRYPSEPERVYRRKASYIGNLSTASLGASRFPQGHHEGFVEAFANIYDSFVKAVYSRKAGDFPGVREGVRSMRFVEAALASAAEGSVWKRL